VSPDLFNGIFEAGGAVLLWLDVQRLHRDKMLRGVYWPVRVFFASWGFWNIYYYHAIQQPFSFWAGLGVVAANTVWCLLAWKYRKL
jgi:hypothetical protein